MVAPILGLLLQSQDAQIRRVAVRTLDKTVALGVSPLLRRMIGDPDREVRLVVVRLLAYAEDTASVELMNKTLMRVTTDGAERRELYRALGEIGGLAAGDVLTAELVRQSEVELRIALISNFGRAWSPKAAQTVGDLASKLLGNAKLRAACKAAVANADSAAAGKTQATAPVGSSGAGLRPGPGYSSSPSTIARAPVAPSAASAPSTLQPASGQPVASAYASSPSTVARDPSKVAQPSARQPVTGQVAAPASASSPPSAQTASAAVARSPTGAQQSAATPGGPASASSPSSMTREPAVPAYPRAPSPLARDLAPAGPGAPAFAGSASGLIRSQAQPPAPVTGSIAISKAPLPPGAPVPKPAAPYAGSPSTIAISGDPFPTTISIDGDARPSAPPAASSQGTPSSGSGDQPK